MSEDAALPPGNFSVEETHVALTNLDRDLLKRCLAHQPGAWNDFVDRFLGLIYHVVHHTAHLRSAPLRPEDTEDLAAEVLLQIVAHDYAVLRQFRGNSSLATYLTVIARRICVHELSRRSAGREVQPGPAHPDLNEVEADDLPRTPGLESLEEVEKLLSKLPGREREVVRLHYIEGRSYEEISTELKFRSTASAPSCRAPARSCVRMQRPRRRRSVPSNRSAIPNHKRNHNLSGRASAP